MKLGAKSKNVDNFVDKLISEGEEVRSSSARSKKADVAKTTVPAALTERSCFYDIVTCIVVAFILNGILHLC